MENDTDYIWREKMSFDKRYTKAWIYLCGFDYTLLVLVESFRLLGNDMNGIAPALAITISAIGLVLSAFAAHAVGSGNGNGKDGDSSAVNS